MKVSDQKISGMVLRSCGTSIHGLLTLLTVLFLNLSDTVEGKDVQFFLFTKNDESLKQEISVGDRGSNLHETSYDPEHPTKIIIHGFNSHPNAANLVEIHEEYLKRAPTNVIAVDWSILAAGPQYSKAVKNVATVGISLAQLITRLNVYGAMNIHVIGFSLGAHVAAVAAKYLKPYNVSRITGLDPARPLSWTSKVPMLGAFRTYADCRYKPEKELNHEDADFVDIYHAESVVLGDAARCGHVDFYMNGGKNQPGCGDIVCSHSRALRYFAESINSKDGFWSACPSSVLAGDPVDKSSRGAYVAWTNPTAPFALGRRNHYDSNNCEEHTWPAIASVLAGNPGNGFGDVLKHLSSPSDSRNSYESTNSKENFWTASPSVIAADRTFTWPPPPPAQPFPSRPFSTFTWRPTQPAQSFHSRPFSTFTFPPPQSTFPSFAPSFAVPRSHLPFSPFKKHFYASQ